MRLFDLHVGRGGGSIIKTSDLSEVYEVCQLSEKADKKNRIGCKLYSHQIAAQNKLKLQLKIKIKIKIQNSTSGIRIISVQELRPDALEMGSP